MDVLVLEPFKALPKGGAKVMVSRDGQTFEMVFWSNQWKQIQEKYGNRFQIGEKINKISFYGVEKEYRGAIQIEFVRFPDKEGSGAA